MIDVFGVKIDGVYSSKGLSRLGLHTFNMTITNGPTSVGYTFYAEKGLKDHCIEDPDGFREPRLTERGLHEALACFVSEALSGRHKKLVKELGLDPNELQMVEDAIIRKYQVTYGDGTRKYNL